MAKILIEKTILVRDKYGVKRQAFVAGDEVEAREYYAVLATNAIINPEDLPKVENPKQKLKHSLAVSAPPKEERKILETKVLDPEPVIREELPAKVEEEVKEIEEAEEPKKKVIKKKTEE